MLREALCKPFQQPGHGGCGRLGSIAGAGTGKTSAYDVIVLWHEHKACPFLFAEFIEDKLLYGAIQSFRREAELVGKVLAFHLGLCILWHFTAEELVQVMPPQPPVVVGIVRCSDGHQFVVSIGGSVKSPVFKRKVTGLGLIHVQHGRRQVGGTDVVVVVCGRCHELVKQPQHRLIVAGGQCEPVVVAVNGIGVCGVRVCAHHNVQVVLACRFPLADNAGPARATVKMIIKILCPALPAVCTV